MSEGEGENKGLRVSDSDDGSTDLTPLLPLAEQFLENQRRSIEENSRLSEKRIEADERHAERSWVLRKRRFWLLSACTAGLFAIVAGLIFIQKNVPAGLTILSHVGAVVAGLLAGIGWEKTAEDADVS
ncbi:hypothetical protein KBTX_02673 [wastewater metagenome]|uniref:DUF2335 domain-containing protein n=2 Tax=unclassified sequences TaxID=12908 RepID=A0A5B8RCH3_9ZZZZ|nr:hypothetical protein [Arhodomonas sp. KWT]QEA06341.1 hypothetical protein KBTEX_02673 [uncultured organism]